MGKDTPTTYLYHQATQKVTLSSGPVECEELLGKCTCPQEAKKILKDHPGAYISEDSTYSESDLFRYE